MRTFWWFEYLNPNLVSLNFISHQLHCNLLHTLVRISKVCPKIIRHFCPPIQQKSFKYIIIIILKYKFLIFPIKVWLIYWLIESYFTYLWKLKSLIIFGRFVPMAEQLNNPTMSAYSAPSLRLFSSCNICEGHTFAKHKNSNRVTD